MKKLIVFSLLLAGTLFTTILMADNKKSQNNNGGFVGPSVAKIDKVIDVSKLSDDTKVVLSGNILEKYKKISISLKTALGLFM